MKVNKDILHHVSNLRHTRTYIEKVIASIEAIEPVDKQSEEGLKEARQDAYKVLSAICNEINRYPL